jgi:hypothetical protein
MSRTARFGRSADLREPGRDHQHDAGTIQAHGDDRREIDVDDFGDEEENGDV